MAVGIFFFLPVRGGSERGISASGGDAQAGRPGLQIRPRGVRIWCSLARISHGHPLVDPPAAARSSPLTPRPRRPDLASRCADLAGGIALVLRWRAGLLPGAAVPRREGLRLDDGEASSGFRNYF